MTCTIFLVNASGWAVYDLWTATGAECSDWLAFFKWAYSAGGWREWR